MQFSITFAVISSLSVVLAAQSNPFAKSDHEKVLNRQKRFLIFPGGGVAKFVGKVESSLIESFGK